MNDTKDMDEKEGGIEDENSNGNEKGEQDQVTEPTGQKRDVAAEYLDALQRERASFINYKRRAEQERAETVQYATTNLVKKLLPVVDDFDRALAAIPEAEREKNRWVEGIELIARKLHTLLEQEGIEPIEAMGQPFDPNLHEAVAFEDNTEGGNTNHVDTVSDVFAKGYKMRDRVIRPAMVKVSRG
ncbi:MAG: nucleotide exchange factor GrpE [Chloroflexi bacterium]|nr:nucleotide exchange factor GrpE [Chloroflexota bacterium]